MASVFHGIRVDCLTFLTAFAAGFLFFFTTGQTYYTQAKGMFCD